MDITATLKFIIVIAIHQGTMPRVALCGNVQDEQQSLLTNSRATIYGCAIGSLQDGFELPPIGETEPKLIFVIQQLPFFICNYKSSLTVNLTRSDDRCGLQLNSEGSVSIMDRGVYEFKREAYCIAAATRIEIQFNLCGKPGMQLLNASLACTDSILKVEPAGEYDTSSTHLLISLIWCLTCIAIDLVIILVYVALWGKHSCYGWSVLALVMSLLCYYATFATAIGVYWKLTGSETSEVALLRIRNFAITMIVFQFTYICSYSWTLVLGYHVWKMLRTLKPKPTELEDRRRFLKYSTFGFGLPLCITGVTLVVIAGMTSNDFTWSIIVYSWRYRYYFIYLPVAILFLVSLALLCSTLSWLREAKRNRVGLRIHGQPATSSSSYTNAVLVSKMMVLMGAVLAFDVIAYILVIFGLGEAIPTSVFELVYRIGHSGCLFWIFVWNKIIREELPAKFSFCAHLSEGKIEDSSVATRSSCKT